MKPKIFINRKDSKTGQRSKYSKKNLVGSLLAFCYNFIIPGSKIFDIKRSKFEVSWTSWKPKTYWCLANLHIQRRRSSKYKIIYIEPITLENSCYLIGKDDRVCDILCENHSISRQHAVIQFRMSMIRD